LSIYGANRTVSFRIVRHFDEAKASRLTGITVRYDAYTIDTAVSFKKRTDVLLGCLETEVPNKNVLHDFSFDLRAGNSGGRRNSYA